MAKTLQKEKAQDLRRSGLSINEIYKKLNVSKVSVSYWCRDIILSDEQIEKISNKTKKARSRGLLLSSENKRGERIKRTIYWRSIGKDDVSKLSRRDIFMTGLGLYWGEGCKKGNEETSFNNTDPNIIKLLIYWLKEFYGVGKEDLILRVSINNIHKARASDIIDYWSNLLKISKKQFTKTSLIKSKVNKIYKNNKTYYGTLRVRARRGTNIIRRILGSIDALGSFNV